MIVRASINGLDIFLNKKFDTGLIDWWLTSSKKSKCQPYSDDPTLGVRLIHNLEHSICVCKRSLNKCKIYGTIDTAQLYMPKCGMNSMNKHGQTSTLKLYWIRL